MMTIRRDRFIKELATSKSASEAARKAGYSPKRAGSYASQLMKEPELKSRIDRLVGVGLNTLEDVAVNGRVEIARAQAAKTLVETGLGKPKDNKQSMFGDITINVSKIGDLKKVIDV